MILWLDLKRAGPLPHKHKWVVFESLFDFGKSILSETSMIYTHNLRASLRLSVRKLVPAMAGMLFRLLVSFLLISNLVYWSNISISTRSMSWIPFLTPSFFFFIFFSLNTIILLDCDVLFYFSRNWKSGAWSWSSSSDSWRHPPGNKIYNSWFPYS